MQTKVCTKCGIEKDINDFGQRKGKCRKPGDRHAECKQCTNARRVRNYQTRPEVRTRCKDSSNRDYAKLCAEVIAAYGGKCTCCGETQQRFLTIDHEDETGAEHRREIGTGAKVLCNYLKRNNFPPGYQVLCFNCNCAKGFFGICPHKQVDNSCNSYIPHS